MLSFSGALDPATAENLANYSLVGPIGRHGVRSYAVVIDSAVYDPASSTVTLALARRWNVHRQWKLIVKGWTGGVAGASGMPLTGSAHGHAKATVRNNYVTTISMKNLAGRASKLPIDARAKSAVARAEV